MQPRLKLYRGKWTAVWEDAGQTRRISLRTSDREEADRRFHDLRPAEVEGDLIEHKVTAYLAQLEKDGRASHAVATSCWNILKPMFGHLRPDQVDGELCQTFIDARRGAGIGDGTILKNLSVLRTALKDTPAKFKFPPAPDPRDRYLIKEEFETLLTGFKQRHLVVFTVLALTTAARSTAILQLTWDRVDFQRGRVNMKSGAENNYKGRSIVPMNNRMRAMLTEAYEARECKFVVSWGGRGIGSIKKGFRTACSAAGFDDVTPHTIRHTAAVWMAEGGISMSEIAQFLGHKNDRVTQRVYARYSPDYLQKAAGALE